MSQIKGGKTVSRQNFSMHPELLKAIFETASTLSTQRSNEILTDRSLRVTYSKVVAALVFDALERGLIQTDDGGKCIPTQALERIIARFEASDYEQLLPVQPKKPSKGGQHG